jgi:uncharacterized cupredoxin-like copper-binding protein
MPSLSCRRLLSVVAIAIASVTLAACGGDDESSSSNNSSGSSGSKKESTGGSSSTSSGGGGGKLTLAASESGGLSFTKKQLSAKAGKVTITMDNPTADKLPHAVAIEGNGVDKDGETVQPGSKSTVTADLKPGKYEFYCPVDGHKQAGMEGTLTVK